MLLLLLLERGGKTGLEGRGWAGEKVEGEEKEIGEGPKMEEEEGS